MNKALFKEVEPSVSPIKKEDMLSKFNRLGVRKREERKYSTLEP
jgi:hypothetical protein